MSWEMVCKQSTSTARDMVRAIIEDAEEPPTIEAARRISEEYLERGCYIKPEWLLDVWIEEKRE